MNTKIFLSWTKNQANELANECAKNLNSQVVKGSCTFGAEWTWALEDCTWARPSTISGVASAYIVETDTQRAAFAWLDATEEECEKTVLNYLSERLQEHYDCSEDDAKTLVDIALEVNRLKISEKYCDDERMEYLYNECYFSIYRKADYCEEFKEFLIIPF